MFDAILQIEPSIEKARIISFIKNTLQKQGFEKVVIGLSGGIDSATAFYLLKDAVKPQNIFIAHLYYFESQFKAIEPMLKQAKIPKENIYEISIAPIVKAFVSRHSGKLSESEMHPESPTAVRDAGQASMTDLEKVRLGNIMARIRMIILFDIAKKNNALVCGTENRSEHLLGYFTRFGDEASDIEPIRHLYKTQVFELAKQLGVPKNIIEKEPSANLWQAQTDEGEFGFTYKEADQVLFYYYDKKLKLKEIKNKGYKNAEKIIDFVKKNSFKHHLPYALK